MALALPGAKGLFSHIQEELSHMNGKRFILTQGMHAALSDLRWLTDDPAKRPTHLYELVPLPPSVDGYHDAPRTICGRVILPVSTAVSREIKANPSTSLTYPYPEAPQPMVWRANFPPDVVANLVIWSNPTGGTTNSDLDMAGSVLNNDDVEKCFNVQEQTVLSRTDNMETMWWQHLPSNLPELPKCYNTPQFD